MEIQNSLTLKSLANTRITVDLLSSTIENIQKTCPFTILVVDNYSAKVLSSYLTMSDLLNRGIFTVELITNKRNRFPNYGVIYFISPTQKSISKLIEDFSNLKRPKYNRAYIFFTHRLPENLLEMLVTDGVIKRTMVLKELNLSFFTKEENVFDFDWESGLKIFNCSEENQNKMLQSICDRLFTVLTTLNIHPYIQYQGSSHLCKILGQKIEDIFTNNKFCKNLKKEGILLLTDRSIDVTTPLLHDYNYRSLIYDLMEVKNNTINLNNKKIVLSDDNELWKNYKLLHIAEVFQKLSKDFDDFQKSDLSKIGKNSNMDSFSDMANALTNMSSYRIKTNQLSSQIHLAEELNKIYKNNHIYEIIELEQDIVSGVNDGGKINNRDIFKNFTITKSKLNNQREDFIRILLTLYTSLSIDEKDFNFLSGKLTEEESGVLGGMTKIGFNPQSSGKKNERRKNNIIREKISLVGEKIAKKVTFSSLRSSPNIAILAEQASNYLLDRDQYPYINWDREDLPKVEKKFGTKNLFDTDSNKEADLSELEPMIVFNIGGLAYNEITSLEKLQNNNTINHRIYIGSTGVMNAKEYMKQLREINDEFSKEIGKDCLDDELEEEDDKLIKNNDNKKKGNNDKEKIE
jgi:syntaxin-binding protein 1